MEVNKIYEMKESIKRMQKELECFSVLLTAEIEGLSITKSPEITTIKIDYETGKFGKIDAIKKIRQVCCCGLMEAKLLVDSWIVK